MSTYHSNWASRIPQWCQILDLGYPKTQFLHHLVREHNADRSEGLLFQENEGMAMGCNLYTNKGYRENDLKH